MNTKNTLMAAGALCCALAIGGAFANDTSHRKSDQPLTDTVITTKVKAELAKDRATKAMAIHVKTEDGVVMLTGTVRSAAEKAKAEQDARSVKGVVKVTNDLAVKS
jgi:osmotically-inducible protein OsmY